jgi:outer membrane protein assembly factor BamB
VYSSPAVGGDGTIYVGSADGQLYAINPDGSLKWSFPTVSSVISSPAIGGDGTIYVGSYDYKLYAIGPGPPIICEFTLLQHQVPKTGTLDFNMTWTSNRSLDQVTVEGQFEIYKGTTLMRTISYAPFNIQSDESRTRTYALGPVPGNAPQAFYTIINKVYAEGDSCQCEDEFEVIEVGWID